jgi:UDP-N-acetylmuramate--alanine ligase
VKGQKRKVHFIGAGGIGMSGLAEILLNLDYEVSGSDLSPSPITDRLSELGMAFCRGHAPENLGNAEVVVVSAAVDEENSELREAASRGLPIIHRSDLLADLIRLKPHAVVVGGTHGKTTTTSMVSAILDRADMGATTIVGGILHRSGTNARWGTGDCLVAEADEHDGSFLRLHPTIAVVTNIDAEHLEYYGTLDRIKQAFIEFCNGVPFYGFSVLCRDDEHCRAILDDLHSVSITYGLEDGASLVASNVGRRSVNKSESLADRLRNTRTRFDVTSHDERLHTKGTLGAIEIKALGPDNVRNALAACAVGLCLGLSFEAIAEGLGDFDGVQRRMQVRGEARGVAVVEDYAHHPTELASTLAAVRCAEPGRIVCVFQPHLYSRTKFFSVEFAQVLASADRAIVTEIYASREAPMPGVDAALIVDEARKNGADHVELVREMNDVPARLAATLHADDVVLVLGAGDINRIVEPILNELERP